MLLQFWQSMSMTKQISYLSKLQTVHSKPAFCYIWCGKLAPFWLRFEKHASPMFKLVWISIYNPYMKDYASSTNLCKSTSGFGITRHVEKFALLWVVFLLGKEKASKGRVVVKNRTQLMLWAYLATEAAVWSDIVTTLKNKCGHFYT